MSAFHTVDGVSSATEQTIYIGKPSEAMLKAFHDAWRALHNMVDPTQEKLSKWSENLPGLGCGACSAGYEKLLEKLPPRFDDWFAWTFDLRNAVRIEKLALPPWDWQAAIKQWRPQLAWRGQPEITEFVAVTSLAPLRLERQTLVLDSWKQFGLKIVSVNTVAEFEAIGKDYPQVSAWIHSESDCKTQRINSLLDVATLWDLPILLINSDIEIYGDQSRLIELVRACKSAIGIRHNYEVQPGDATLERWGLDAYLIYPEQVAKLPGVDWAIGKPMWDYWLAWELNRMGVAPEWIGDPYFFHKSHPVAWTQEECTKSHLVFNEQFEPMDWARWRSQQPFWLG